MSTWTRQAELTLISPSQRPIPPLVEGALRNALRRLEAGIRRSAQRLQEFEARHGLSTADFRQRYEENALEETREFAASSDRRLGSGQQTTSSSGARRK